MKTLKNIMYTTGLFVAVSFTGCADPMEEITNINYERAFSPLALTVRVRNQVDVELNWTPGKADSYVVEVFKNDSLTFAGVPTLTFSNVKAVNLPYTITGLDGSTPYSFRVKAVLGGTSDSRWSAVYAKTQAENIFIPFQENDIQANSVKLRWTPSDNVTRLTLETAGGSVIAHTLTAAEKEDGVATIASLTGETEYIAKIFNGELQRGRVTFTTLLDLGSAIAVYPTDNLSAKLAAANAGDVFALFPGTYGEATQFAVAANIEIKAVYPNDKPIIKGYFSLTNNAALLLKDVVVDGSNLTDGNQAIVFETAGANYGDVVIDGCQVKNHTKGIMYLNVAATVKSFVINNSIISNVQCVGGDFIDIRTGAVESIRLSKSTVYNSVAARDFIRYDNTAAAFPAVMPAIVVEHCTLDGISNSESRRLLYVRNTQATISFKNTLVSNTLGIFSNQSSTPAPIFSKNNYFNATGLQTGGSAISKIFDDAATTLDPGYAAVASGNFKISNQTIIDQAIGDPRWWQ